VDRLGNSNGRRREEEITVIGVKIEKANKSPEPLLKNGATWALSFNFDAIKKAAESA
jgi:hypothetical protein